MRVLLINLEFDCAGVAWNLRNALQAMGHEAQHVTRRPTYAASHTDKLFKHVDDIMPLCEWADVLHFNQWIWTHTPGMHTLEFLPGNPNGVGNHPFKRFVGHKQFVYHFHGGKHQLCPDYWIDECKAANAAMLKCDPLCPIPEARWIPNVLDIQPEQQVDYDGPFQVAVMGSLSDQRRNNMQVQHALNYLGIKHNFFGTVPRDEALHQRKQYQVTIDNFTQGFTGMWSWEALSMGQVVIARLDDAVGEAYDTEIGEGDPCPIQHAANVDVAMAYLRMLMRKRDMVQRIGQAGIDWMRKHYSQESIATKYLEVYRRGL
jgi:hypothetical protein